jgi:hypothetical protein
VGTDADGADSFGAVAHENAVFEVGALGAAVGEDEADVCIEVAVGTDVGVWGDDDAHGVGKAETGADGGAAADFDFKEPEEELGREDGGEVVAGEPELEADEGEGVDAVEGESQGEAAQRGGRAVVGEVALEVLFEV